MVPVLITKNAGYFQVTGFAVINFTSAIAGNLVTPAAGQLMTFAVFADQ